MHRPFKIKVSPKMTQVTLSHSTHLLANFGDFFAILFLSFSQITKSLAEIIIRYGYSFGTVKTVFLESKIRKISPHIAESVVKKRIIYTCSDEI